MKRIRERYLKERVQEDLAERMAFIGRPRQVGKTTFALAFPSELSESHPAYLNLDDIITRYALRKGRLPANQERIVLDEIHKFARWRNLIKGFYDTRRSNVSCIINGSARLDYYSKGGDSLHGRYHYYQASSFFHHGTEPASDYRRFQNIAQVRRFSRTMFEGGFALLACMHGLSGPQAGPGQSGRFAGEE